MGCGDKVTLGGGLGLGTTAGKQPGPYSDSSLLRRAIDATNIMKKEEAAIFGASKAVPERERGTRLVIEREPAQPAPLPPIKNIQLNVSVHEFEALRFLLQNAVRTDGRNGVINKGSAFHDSLRSLITAVANTYGVI